MCRNKRNKKHRKNKKYKEDKRDREDAHGNKPKNKCTRENIKDKSTDILGLIIHTEL